MFRGRNRFVCREDLAEVLDDGDGNDNERSQHAEEKARNQNVRKRACDKVNHVIQCNAY